MNIVPFKFKPHDENKKPSLYEKTATLSSTPLNFKISLSTSISTYHEQPVSIQDRAATIAIQCAYELWKERRIVARQKDNDSDVLLIDSELQKDIQPFLQLYGTHASTSESTHNTNEQEHHHHHHRYRHHPPTLSFDLLFLWIQFLNTIGLQTSCIEMMLCIIDVIFLSIDDDRDDKDAIIEQNLYHHGDRYEDDGEYKYHNDNSVTQVLDYKFKIETNHRIMEVSDQNSNNDFYDDDYDDDDYDDDDDENDDVIGKYCTIIATRSYICSFWKSYHSSKMKIHLKKLQMNYVSL